MELEQFGIGTSPQEDRAYDGLRFVAVREAREAIFTRAHA